MTLEQLKALYKLYPQVTNTKDGIAYDKDGSEIAYDLQAVTEQAESDAQAVIDTKQAALNKLMALGLTEEEALALGK
jgi:hypothetical protein